jgi:hypothetical protein
MEKLSLSLLLGFTMEFAAVVWWASALSEKVEAHEEALNKQEVMLEKVNQLQVDVARMNAQVELLVKRK